MAKNNIQIHNASESRVRVQCYEPKTNNRWGHPTTIPLGQSRTVYTAGTWEQGPDLFIQQIDENPSLVLKEVRFKSKKDRNWQADEPFVIRSENKDPSEPKKKPKHPWHLVADSVRLVDVEYEFLENPEDMLDWLDWFPERIAVATVTNRGATEAVMRVELEMSYNHSFNWSKNVGLTTSIEASVQASIPLFVDGTLKTSTTETRSLTWGEEISESMAWKIIAEVTVPPESSVRILAIPKRGVIDVPYVGTLEMSYDEGREKRRTTIRGNYEGALVDSAEIIIEEPEPLTAVADEVADEERWSFAANGPETIVQGEPGERILLLFDRENVTEVSRGQGLAADPVEDSEDADD